MGLAEVNQGHAAEAEAAFRKSIELSNHSYALSMTSALANPNP